MSSQLPSSQLLPQAGFIYLVLLSQENPFYLEIPTAIVATVCLKPRKYLRYLGWCVLGIIGVLKDGQGNEIALEGELVDQSVYHYIVPDDQDVLAQAVDLEVIKERTHDPSETTESLDDFCAKLLERDGCCVWTGFSMPMGMHIIPHRRGDEWLRYIIENRPHDENSGTLININDIQNGICATDFIDKRLFDPRKVVVLKTPNPILGTNDVPNRHQRNHIDVGFSYPPNSRYTLQWIVTPPTVNDVRLCPNNNDATFRDQRLHKPADVLLHYNYGAAAVKQWGKGINALADRRNIPRPPEPTPAPIGPTRGEHSHDTTIRKREAAMSQGEQASRKRKRTEGPRGATGSEVQDKWDEDDVILFFWGNSREARERHAREEQERIEYLEGWRAAVTVISASESS